jgi:ubiquinone biosynthesis protein
MLPGAVQWIGTLVPEAAARWRPLVADALQYVISHLSAPRRDAKIAEQLALPPNTPAAKRLGCLIAKMPGLQKIGQVLARNQRLSRGLRRELTRLENGLSDVTAEEIQAIVRQQLGDRLAQFQVKMAPRLLSEGSVSAVLRFTWQNPDRERERGVFKVMKPYIPGYLAEDLALLQGLGKHVADRDVDEALTEVRLLLERELDFAREQATLAEAAQTYRGTLGVRVPRVIPPLCTAEITAMSDETGVKVTEAARRSPIRQQRIAEQIIEALIAVPLLSGRQSAMFHADPHAGNLFYDEPNRELIVLDWALAERLSLESRRQLALLAVTMVLQDRDGVRRAIRALRRTGGGDDLIDAAVDRFFDGLPPGHAPGMLDGMRLLDGVALQGVQFAAPLFLFRKSLFTLDGVLRDVAGEDVRIDTAMVRHFLTRWAASFGIFYSPLELKDFLGMMKLSFTGFGRTVRGSTPSPTTK